MDAITKESKEWLAALALVPEKYMPSECDGVTSPRSGWCDKCGNLPHSSIPDISPDLLYAILEVMVTKYRTMQAIDWEMNFEGRSFRDAIIRAAASLVASLAVERD